MPQICKYWQQGSCKYGDTCRFDHPGNGPKLSNGNRFALLQNHSHVNSNFPNRSGVNQDSANLTSYTFKESIIHDLTVDKPQWPLSAYGLGRYAPAQLFGGFPREQSFEEMRLHHYLASSDQKKLYQAIQDANKLFQDAEEQTKHAIQNIDDAVNYLVEAGQKHPNREDICKQTQSGELPITPLTAGNTSFSQNTSNLNQFNQTRSSAQITPASIKPPAPIFGSTAPAGAFGQPSALGQKINPFVNQVPKFGSSTESGGIFGKISGSTASNCFVNPNNNLFGQKSNVSSSIQPPKSGLFNNPNTFNSTSFQLLAGTSSLSSNQNPGNPFPPSNLESQSSYLSKPAAAPSISVSPFNSNNNTLASTNTNNQFSQLSKASGTRPSGFAPRFGEPNVLPNIFSSNAMLPPKIPEKSSPHESNLSVSNQLSNSRVAVNSHHSISEDSPKSFKGKPVEYRNNTPGYIKNDGSWERIWFLYGEPHFSADAKMPPETVYDELTIKAYNYARENKKFENGIIPTLPPKEEWCRFDF